MSQTRYWFRRNRVGWGLEPGSREGWIATILFVVMSIGGVIALAPVAGKAHAWILITWAIGWSVAFIVVTLVKGEKLW
jgi:hypothetical protein